MASTAVDMPGAALPAYKGPAAGSDEEKKGAIREETASIGVGDQTHRKLKSRHIQLIGTPSP
jgi:amino acid transporter